MDNEGPHPTRAPTGEQVQIECKVLVLAAGAMGTPTAADALAARFFPPSRRRSGSNLGVNGDHVAAIEFDPARVQSVLGLPGYHEFYKGKPITTMSYDWWVGRRGARVRRHPLHPPGDLPLDADELPLRQRPHRARRPVVVGPAEEAGGRPLVQPDRVAGDGRGHARRDVLAAAAERGRRSAPAPGPIAIGTFNYAMSEQSLAIRAAANEAIASGRAATAASGGSWR